MARLPLLLLPALGAALRAGQVPCAPFEAVVQFMRLMSNDANAQIAGCSHIARCTDSSKKAAQNAAVQAGILEAMTDAMRRFPNEKALQSRCITAIGKPILFNRQNGLRAGRLGGLNLTLAAYRKWMGDPEMMGKGGDIGCYLDFCDENRAILRELGGVEMLIQNIKNNFHGSYSEWSPDLVKQSLFGLSSGTWLNQDIAKREGMIQLILQVVGEHPSSPKIAEEAMQVTKALLSARPENRQEFADGGLAGVLAKVLKENPTDRGATSLACETARYLIGPSKMGGKGTKFPFSAEIQAQATKAGLLQQLLTTTMSGAQLQHRDHAAFNFDIDNAYNARADCIEALTAMAVDSAANVKSMVAAGLHEYLSGVATGPPIDARGGASLCRLLGALATGAENATARTAMQRGLDVCHR